MSSTGCGSTPSARRAGAASRRPTSRLGLCGSGRRADCLLLENLLRAQGQRRAQGPRSAQRQCRAQGQCRAQRQGWARHRCRTLGQWRAQRQNWARRQYRAQRHRGLACQPRVLPLRAAKRDPFQVLPPSAARQGPLRERRSASGRVAMRPLATSWRTTCAPQLPTSRSTTIHC